MLLNLPGQTVNSQNYNYSSACSHCMSPSGSSHSQFHEFVSKFKISHPFNLLGYWVVDSGMLTIISSFYVFIMNT